MRWVWRGSALAALVIGWVFIAWQNHFHITAPLVFVCLGYLAVVATVYNLWRTGAAVASSDDDGDSTWAKPAGALGELEREKRTLLKAIKEAEFDHQMGKLSQRDVDDMVRTYRARAIEVIKEIDRLGHGAAGSAREQILREVRARLAIDARPQKKPEAEPTPGAKPGAGGTGAKGTKPKPLATEAEPQATEPAATSAADPPGGLAGSSATPPASVAPEAGAASEAAGAAATAIATPVEATPVVAAPAAAQRAIDDEAMDADSTTTVEPKRNDPAKEATP